MSNAEEIFKRIKNEGIVSIQRFVEERKEESEWLDFKNKEEPENGLLGENDKKTFAKALSGFLNGSGGVLVWGVETEKRKDEPDVATDLKPISKLKKFLTDLQNYMPEAITPSPQKVEFEPIEETTNSDKGYLVILIPQSDLPPHRIVARIKDIQNHYYRRTGASTRIMSHSELEDLFGRRPKPKPILVCKLYRSGGMSGATNYVDVSIDVGIKNEGRGILKYPSLTLFSSKGYEPDQYGLDGNGNRGLKLRKKWGRANVRHYVGGADDIVNHKDELWIDRYTMRISFDDARSEVLSPENVKDFEILAMINGEGILPQKFSCKIGKGRLIDFLENRLLPEDIPCYLVNEDSD